MNQKYLSPLLAIVLVANISTPADATVSAGLLSDFQDLTTQGWSGGAAPINVANSGPAGIGDHFLQIGGGNNLATFNSGPGYSGALDLSITLFQVDMMRPVTDPGPLDMRLVLFGSGANDSWTSSAAQSIPNDGVWRTYTFSIAEGDLTQVRGIGSYGNLVANIDRVMFRHDPGPPSNSGESVSGNLGIDNVTAVPEPSVFAMLAIPALAIGARRRR